MVYYMSKKIIRVALTFCFLHQTLLRSCNLFLFELCDMLTIGYTIVIKSNSIHLSTPAYGIQTNAILQRSRHVVSKIFREKHIKITTYKTALKLVQLHDNPVFILKRLHEFQFFFTLCKRALL